MYIYYIGGGSLLLELIEDNNNDNNNFLEGREGREWLFVGEHRRHFIVVVGAQLIESELMNECR